MKRPRCKRGKRRPYRGYNRRERAPFWVLVRTPLGRERFAREQLAEKGNKTFLPRVHDKWKSGRLTALFPGYVFVQVEQGAWLHLQYCRGVIEVLRMGDRVARVPDDEMEQLLTAAGRAGNLGETPQSREPVAGDELEIIKGVFKGHTARYIGLDPKRRVQLFLSILGKEVELTVKRNEVMPI